jgi:hypothetical protein
LLQTSRALRDPIMAAEVNVPEGTKSDTPGAEPGGQSPALGAAVSAELAVERWQRGAVSRTRDFVAEEVPVALACHDVPHVVMLTTPANLEDQAVGFTLSEALMAGTDEIRGVTVMRGAGRQSHAVPSEFASCTVSSSVQERQALVSTDVRARGRPPLRRLRQPLICDEYCWTRLGTNVFLGRLRSPGQSASTLVNRLIPMGVWCDFARNRRTEKTDAIHASTHRSPGTGSGTDEFTGATPDAVAT